MNTGPSPRLSPIAMRELAAAIGPVAWTHAGPPPAGRRTRAGRSGPPGCRARPRQHPGPTAHSNEPALEGGEGDLGRSAGCTRHGGGPHRRCGPPEGGDGDVAAASTAPQRCDDGGAGQWHPGKCLPDLGRAGNRIRPSHKAPAQASARHGTGRLDAVAWTVSGEQRPGSARWPRWSSAAG